MTQNRVSQAARSLGCMYNKNIDKVYDRKLWIKSWYNSKNLWKIFLIFLVQFLDQNCSEVSRPNLFIQIDLCHTTQPSQY